MKNRICIFVALILLSQAILLPILASEAEADTRVTITFAAGGVACGAFVFFQLVFRASMLQQDQNDTNALFNRGSEGWQIKFPSMNFRQDEEHKIFRSEHSPETLQVALLKFRF
jgi:uncharacterized membrane protein